MTLSKLRAVVSTNWLRETIGSQVKKAGKELRVLDASYVSDREIDTYREFYLQGHIPQALSFNMFKCTESTELIPRNIPDISCFTDYAQSLGIHRDTHVVAYDRFGPLGSYRTWWIFRLFGHKNISVLDGGLRKWLEDGYEVTSEVPEVERSDFQVRFDSSMIRDFDAMMKNVKSQKEQVLDARGYEAFAGIAEGGGHIPSSKRLHYTDLFREDTTLKSEEELKQMFDEAGVDLNRPLVTSCLLGMSACCLAAAANILGKEDVPIYYGSWNEWRQRASEAIQAKLREE